MRIVSHLVLALVVLVGPALALTPPWYFAHAQIRAAFEGGPVKVLELEQRDGHWVVPVAVSGEGAADIGAALTTVIKKSLLSGSVVVEVRLPGGTVAQPLAVAATPEAAIGLLSTALKGNVHLSGVFASGPGVLIELKPEILQFFADNLTDRHGLAHYPAAALFQDLLDVSALRGTRVFFSYAQRP